MSDSDETVGPDSDETLPPDDDERPDSPDLFDDHPLKQLKGIKKRSRWFADVKFVNTNLFQEPVVLDKMYFGITL